MREASAGLEILPLVSFSPILFSFLISPTRGNGSKQAFSYFSSSSTKIRIFYLSIVLIKWMDCGLPQTTPSKQTHVSGSQMQAKLLVKAGNSFWLWLVVATSYYSKFPLFYYVYPRIPNWMGVQLVLILAFAAAVHFTTCNIINK